MLRKKLRRVAYRKFYREIGRLQEFRRQSPEAIRDYQWRKLREMVEYAYQHVPFYRKLYREAGWKPGDLRTPDDFRKLPVVNREMLMKAEIAERLTDIPGERKFAEEDATSGTTGTPFLFYKDRRLVRREFLLYSLQKFALGWKPGERELIIKGRLYREDREDALMEADDEQTYRLNGFRITREVIPELLEFFQSKNIRWIYGYPTPIRQLCRFARERKMDLSVKTIITMGEVLTRSMRRQLEECYSARVYQLYGAAEAMHMAHECIMREGMHVDSERYYLEVRGRKQPFQGSGSLLITDLLNRVMPLIRYEIGDEVQFASHLCDCGDNTPLIRSVKGKHTEIFRTPSGRELNLHILLDDIFADMSNELATFRLVLKSKKHMVLWLVPFHHNNSNNWKPVVDKLKEYLGKEVRIDWKVVDHLEPELSGKHKSIISKI